MPSGIISSPSLAVQLADTLGLRLTLIHVLPVRRGHAARCMWYPTTWNFECGAVTRASRQH
jgi:hypothetical protein